MDIKRLMLWSQSYLLAPSGIFLRREQLFQVALSQGKEASVGSEGPRAFTTDFWNPPVPGEQSWSLGGCWWGRCSRLAGSDEESQ